MPKATQLSLAKWGPNLWTLPDTSTGLWKWVRPGIEAVLDEAKPSACVHSGQSRWKPAVRTGGPGWSGAMGQGADRTGWHSPLWASSPVWGREP